jgi:hypothetical protein
MATERYVEPSNNHVERTANKLRLLVPSALALRRPLTWNVRRQRRLVGSSFT